MEIELHKIKIKDLVVGYRDDGEGGVFGYGGRLDIRPPYQREFIYPDKKRDLVIDSVMNGFPLNAMYWVVRDDGRYEVLDGQQRTISICQYATGGFGYRLGNNMFSYASLANDIKEKFDNYELLVYFCKGADTEKMDWFKRINVAGMELNEQEIRNAVYAGPFTKKAKEYFSREGCIVSVIGAEYLNGTAKRQDYLQTALDWRSQKDGLSIDTFMSNVKNDENEAEKLHSYIRAVFTWIETIFPTILQREMKGLPWGLWYNDEKIRDKYTMADKMDLKMKMQKLIEDDDVTNQRGIFAYLLTGEDKHLNIRQFDFKQKRKKYEIQGGKCAKCEKNFDMKEMDGDHITPWIEGGKTEIENLQLLCKSCNRTKGKR